jgi:hypothetical protein
MRVDLPGILLACALVSSSVMAADAPSFAVADRIFEDFYLDAHSPELTYGIVADGHGRLKGGLERSPTLPPRIWELKFAAITP